MTVPMPTPEKALEPYKRLVEENDQAVPILLVATPDDRVLPMAIVGDIGDGQMQPALAAALQSVRDAFGAPQWLIFSVESWMKSYNINEVIPDLAPGDISKLRKEGDLTVAECAVITGISTTERWSMLYPFARVGGEVFWGEPDTSNIAEGGIVDILLQAVR